MMKASASNLRRITEQQVSRPPVAQDEVAGNLMNPEDFTVTGHTSPTIEADDPVIYRPQLVRALDVSSETIRRYMLNKILPAPDVNLTNKKRGWKVSTLRAAGINIF